MVKNEKHITSENAREMQALSAKKRKENSIRNKIVTESVIRKLSEPVEEGSDKTLLDYYVDKVLDEFGKKCDEGDVKLTDLKDLKDLADEKTTTSNVTLIGGPSREDIIKEMGKDDAD